MDHPQTALWGKSIQGNQDKSSTIKLECLKILRTITPWLLVPIILFDAFIALRMLLKFRKIGYFFKLSKV